MKRADPALIPSGGPLPLTVAAATFLPDPTCS
jgi:hypothetical protein